MAFGCHPIGGPKQPATAATSEPVPTLGVVINRKNARPKPAAALKQLTKATTKRRNAMKSCSARC